MKELSAKQKNTSLILKTVVIISAIGLCIMQKDFNSARKHAAN